MNARDALLARILDAAAGIKACRGQVRQTTCDTRKRDAKCVEVKIKFSKTYCKLIMF
jgi:hypothetical protein